MRQLHIKLKSTLSTRSADVWSNFFYWLQMTWISELPGQQRMIILGNLNWLYTTRNKSWSNLKLFQYFHWVKETLDTRLYQIWKCLATVGDFFVDRKHCRPFVNEHYLYVQCIIILYHCYVVVEKEFV